MAAERAGQHQPDGWQRPRWARSDMGEDAMAWFVLFYDTVEDYPIRRQPHRAEHLALAQQAHREGFLMLGGALDPPDAALLVFRAESQAAVEEFARQDPYVRHGVVRSWRVRPWTVVIGG
jgi:hypothetical protein